MARLLCDRLTLGNHGSILSLPVHGNTFKVTPKKQLLLHVVGTGTDAYRRKHIAHASIPRNVHRGDQFAKFKGWFLFYFLKEKERKKKKKEGVGETDRRWLSWADIFWEPVLRLPGAIFKRPTSPHCLVDVGERKGVYACKNIQLTQTHVPLQTAHSHAVHTNTCADAQAEGSHS